MLDEQLVRKATMVVKSATNMEKPACANASLSAKC
jgi:hypothetical protein